MIVLHAAARYLTAIRPRLPRWDLALCQPAGYHSTRWLTAITVDPIKTGITREAIRLELLTHQIEARPLWKPMHLQPLYQGAPYHGAGYDAGLFQIGLCLPSGSDMTDMQQDEVIGHIKALVAG